MLETKEPYLKELAAISETITHITTRVVDLMKHLTTLSSGVVVLVVTFRNQITTATHWTWLVPLSIVCFLVCILYSITVCDRAMGTEFRINFVQALAKHDALTAENRRRFGSFEKEVKNISEQLSISHRVSQISFALGILLLGIFIVRNFI